MKKYLVFLIIIAVAVIGGIAYFLTKDYWQKQAEPFEAVPADAAIVFEFHSIAGPVGQAQRSELWQKLKEYGLVNQLEKDLIYLDTIVFPNDGDANANILASLHKIKSDDYGILYILKDAKLNAETYERFKGERKVRERIFRKTKIYEYDEAKGSRSLAIAYKQGLLLLSDQPFLLENAVAQLEEQDENISHEKSFQELKRYSEKNTDPKIYLNFEALPLFLSIYLNSDAQENLWRLKEFSDWLMLDYSLLSKNILLNGYAVSNANSFMNKLTDKNSTADPASVLPFNTALFYSFTLKEKQPADPAFIETYNQYFLNWTGHNAAFAIIEPYSENFEDQKFILIEAADPDVAESQLKELSERQYDVVRVQGEPYKGFEIYHLPEFNDIGQMAGINAAQLDEPYFAIVGKYAVFAKSMASMKVFLERYIEQQTLSRDVDYLAFRKQMSDNPAFNVYINTSRSLQILKSIASPAFKAFLTDQYSTFKILNPLGLQFTTLKNNIYLCGGLLQSAESFQKKTNLMWKTQLDSIAVIRPKVVINHYDQEREIVVQDASNQFYLLSSSGEILWQRQLDSRIVGEIEQVDFYRNGKLQYLFTTRESIYMIDRNGDFVENFPLRMPSEITSGLAHFDYDNNGNYRIFIGCLNGNIYGFEKSGRPLPGWNPMRNVGVLRNPVQHLLVEGRDYLIAANESGKIFYFNRRGETRVPPIDLKTTFNQAFEIELTDNFSFNLINMSDDGLLYTIRQNGNYEVDSAGAFVSPVHFKYRDIAGDEAKEYVVMDKYGLFVYNQNRKLLFEYALPDNVAHEIFFISYPGLVKDRIGLYSEINQQIYLLTDSGNLYDDFPLKGITPFIMSDLYKNNDKVVVTGTADETITTYRLK